MVERAQQHLDRKSLVSLIEGPAVCGALISIGNAAIKVSDSRPIHEGLRARGVRCSPNKELIAAIGEAEGIFLGGAQDGVRRVRREVHPPVRARRKSCHVRDHHLRDKQRRAITRRDRLDRIEDGKNVEWIISRDNGGAAQFGVTSEPHVILEVGNL